MKNSNGKYESARVREYESTKVRECESTDNAQEKNSPRSSHRRRKGRYWAHLALAGLMGVGAAGCTDLAGYDIDMLWGYIPMLSTMRWSVAPRPYEMPRLPAEGSIPAVNPRGDVPPPFTQIDLIEGNVEVIGLENPLQPTPEVLARGQQLYTQHCYACHGSEGAGNGPVVGPGKFPFAPASDAAAVARYSDGYLYGIIRVGRGLMPAYGDRSGHLDRWAMVLYMRQLGAPAGTPAFQAPPEQPAPTTATSTAAEPQTP